jgi:hypothetical protein
MCVGSQLYDIPLTGTIPTTICLLIALRALYVIDCAIPRSLSQLLSQGFVQQPIDRAHSIVHWPIDFASAFVSVACSCWSFNIDPP